MQDTEFLIKNYVYETKIIKIHKDGVKQNEDIERRA